MKEFFDIIGNFGFPVAVSAYLLFRFEKKVDDLTVVNRDLKDTIDDLTKELGSLKQTVDNQLQAKKYNV